MSLRKSPTLTAARLAANRRNALKSTGPRTTRGKAQARLNGLRRGEGARLYYDVMLLLMETPPDRLESTLRSVLTLQEARSRLFRGLVSMIHEADRALIKELRRAHGFGKIPGESFLQTKPECYSKHWTALVVGQNVTENKDVSVFDGLGY